MRFSERLIAEREFRAWATAHGVADRPQSVLAWLETDGQEHLKNLAPRKAIEKIIKVEVVS